MILFKIIGILALGIVIIIICGVLMLLVHLYKVHKLYNYHKCKHCNHYMLYRGTKEREDGNICLFHCEHCEAWEEVPVNEIINML